MPIFDFRCRSCSHEFEALCRDSNTPAEKCPDCNAVKPERLLSLFAVSQGLTPCGSRRAEAAPMCGSGGCGRCE